MNGRNKKDCLFLSAVCMSNKLSVKYRFQRFCSMQQQTKSTEEKNGASWTTWLLTTNARTHILIPTAHSRKVYTQTNANIRVHFILAWFILAIVQMRERAREKWRRRGKRRQQQQHLFPESCYTRTWTFYPKKKNAEHKKQLKEKRNVLRGKQ